MSIKDQTETSACCKPSKGSQSSKSCASSPMTKQETTRTQSGPKTRILIKYDVGFSNELYIRGQGAGLSWDKGLLLKNLGADEWTWETATPFTSCEFKVLINDNQYEIGDNHTLTYGATIQYSPQF